MYTKNLGAFQHCDRDSSGGTVSPFVNRLPGQLPDELFTGHPGKNRISQFGERFELREQLQVMFLELTKTEARVKDDLT